MPEELKMLSIEKIEPNPFQPRETFEHESLRELADSIEESGVLQPILVRPHNKRYQIIAGERRWRACLEAGKKKIPALVRDMDDSELQIASLIENVHRKDLQPMEKAKALFELGKALDLFDEDEEPKSSYREIARDLGAKTKMGERDIRQHLDLLDLPEYIKDEVISTGGKPSEGRITEHHARALRRIKEPETQKRVFEKIKEEKLTGHEAEKLAKLIEKAPEPLKKEVLKKKTEITIDDAQKIMEKVEVAKEYKKVEPEEFTKATIEELKEVKKESHREEERMYKVGDKIAKGEMKARDFPKEPTPIQKKALAQMASMVQDAWWAFDVTVIESMDDVTKAQAINLIKRLHEVCHERLAYLGEFDE